jgi:hypothetical protein
MSLFDKPNEDKLSNDYPLGTPFMLYSAEYEGVRNTSFGPSAQATVTVGAVDRTGDTKDYRVFGSLAEQIKNMESGDLPAIVAVERNGRRHVWTQAGDSATGSDEDIPF